MDLTTTVRYQLYPLGRKHKSTKKTRCRTFAEHCKNEYVLGTSYEHYPFCNLWVNEICAPRVSGTVFFKHKYVTNTTVTTKDSVIAAATNLADALKNNSTPP